MRARSFCCLPSRLFDLCACLTGLLEWLSDRQKFLLLAGFGGVASDRAFSYRLIASGGNNGEEVVDNCFDGRRIADVARLWKIWGSW